MGDVKRMHVYWADSTYRPRSGVRSDGCPNPEHYRWRKCYVQFIKRMRTSSPKPLPDSLPVKNGYGMARESYLPSLYPLFFVWTRFSILPSEVVSVTACSFALWLLRVEIDETVMARSQESTPLLSQGGMSFLENIDSPRSDYSQIILLKTI